MDTARFHDTICTAGWDYDDDNVFMDFTDEEYDTEEFSLDLMILPQYRHQRIGTEVGASIIAFLFDQVQIPRLRVELNPNTKSYKKAARLCVKLGFTNTGRIGDHAPAITGPNDDDHEFWLTNDKMKLKIQ